MADPARPESGYKRPHTPPLAGPFLEFDLTAEIARLHSEATWTHGQNARTLVKHDDVRIIVIALRAQAHIAEHKTDGRISVHVLVGRIRLNADGRTFDLRPGSLLALDQGVPHGIEALEESAFLLTLVRPLTDVP